MLRGTPGLIGKIWNMLDSSEESSEYMSSKVRSI